MALLRSVTLASVGTIAASALLLAACAGKTLSLGNNGTSQSELVSPSAISGTVPPCDSNAAHPNVCCSGGPNEPSSCVTYPNAPFTPCGDGTTTYPDPRSCCPLDGSGNCASPPPLDATPGSSGGGSSGGGTGGGSCVVACPPGWYAPPNASPGECCQSDSNGNTTCSAPASTGCACPGCAPGQTCPPCDCPPPPPTEPTCPACPPGWQQPQGEPGLCCTTDANGVIECFSQAVPPGGDPGPTDAGIGPIPLDAGAPVPMGCSGGGSTDGGGVSQCGCDEQLNGHDYSFSCDSGTGVCTCTVDNGAPVRTVPYTGNDCSDYASLFAACGFPTQ